MVARARHSRRGASTLGCLLSLVFFLGAIYYGSQVGAVYWRLYSFKDTMRTAARFAANQSDVALRLRLSAAVDEIGLPPEAKRNLRIRRVYARRIITIETQYEEAITLPVIKEKMITFKPKVERRY